MSTYAIGDVQGCRESLECLLDTISFNAGEDRLLFAGDLVARGPDSLGTLRLIHSLREHCSVVLGNHDLHLLALAHGREPKRKDQDVLPILHAEDGWALLDWLRQQPLLLDIPEFNAVMTHAGIPPLWTLQEARERAAEVHAALTSADRQRFFDHMYGNEPAAWNNGLSGPERWRVITNHLTRMRFVNLAGDLDLSVKGETHKAPEGFLPWFEHPETRSGDTRILFGHWAALGGHSGRPNIHALDHGCVWDGALAALRLDDLALFTCDCQHTIAQ